MSFVKPGEAAAVEAAVITETVVTPTPVAGVVVESVNTAAAVGPPTASAAPPTPAAPQTQAVVVAPKLSVARAGGMFQVNDFIPTSGDVIWPRLNFAQNIGQLQESFNPGSIVYNQETLLYRPQIIDAKTNTVKEAGTPPVRITVLGFLPIRFAEYVKGGGKGAIVDTEEQVRAAGGTTDYNEHKLKEASGMKKFDPLAQALLAIERPESMADDGTVFVYSADGKQYALALWAMKRTSYTNGAKVIFTKRATGCLQKEGYPSFSFGLSSRWKSFSETTGAWIPVITEPVRQTPEFIKWAAQVVASASNFNSAAAADGDADA